MGDGAARAQVEAALAPLGRNRIIFAGRQSHETLINFYAASDLFVWPAVNEAYGMSLLEAQATGMPAVVGSAGGVADIVDHQVSGLLVPAGDTNAFSKAVASLLDNPETMREMGRAARSRVQCEHSIVAAKAIVERVIRELRQS